MLLIQPIYSCFSRNHVPTKWFNPLLYKWEARSARLGRLWIGALAKVHSTASSLAAWFSVSYQTSLLSWWRLLWYYHSTSFTTIKYRILVIAKFVILGVFLFGEMIGFYGFYPFLQNVIKQVVCWRGHLTRVVGLEHVQSSGVIVSASTDCSVR